ncbi:hypothetical protein CLAIMM_04191, partial [Cladophialophora immunda]
STGRVPDIVMVVVSSQNAIRKGVCADYPWGWPIIQPRRFAETLRGMQTKNSNPVTGFGVTHVVAKTAEPDSDRQVCCMPQPRGERGFLEGGIKADFCFPASFQHQSPSLSLIFVQTFYNHLHHAFFSEAQRADIRQSLYRQVEA